MSVHSKLEDAIGELDDCKKYITKGEPVTAGRKLTDAIQKLTALVSDVKRLERDAK